MHLTGDGRGGGHPSDVLGYYDAPSLNEKVHDFTTWLNPSDTIGFNAASLAPGANTRGKDRAMGFTGPGIACDYLDVEGPLHDVWPPKSHRRLFGDLPLVEFKQAEHPKVPAPKRKLVRQEMGAGKNRPDPVSGVWTVHSDQPLRRRRPPARRVPAAAPSAGPSTPRSAGSMSPGSKSGSRPAIASRRPCAGPTAPPSARPIFCTTSSRPASSTTTRWPAAFRISSGGRCPMSR